MSAQKAAVNFFCIGAQKAGTTTLYHLLSQHPKVYLPKEKEAHFFDDDTEYNKGLDYYLERYFPDQAKAEWMGTITPSYSLFEKVPERIKESLGTKVKFIFILRNPVERLWSQYHMNLSLKRESLSLADAIKAEKKRMQGSLRHQKRYSYVNRGLYAQQIEYYLEYFPKENFLFLDFQDDFVSNLQNGIKKIEEFLKLEHHQYDFEVSMNAFQKNGKRKRIFNRIKRKLGLSAGFKDFQASNKKDKIAKPELSPELEEELLNTIFIQDIKRLESLTQTDYYQKWVLKN